MDKLAADEHLEAKAEATRAGVRSILYLTNKQLLFQELEIARSSISACDVYKSGQEYEARIRIEPQWVCSICSFSNAASTSVCATCGVAMQRDAGVSDVTRRLARGECPQCTFRNHPSLAFCEVCNAPLRQQPSIYEFRMKSREMAAALNGLVTVEPENTSVSEESHFGIRKLHNYGKKSREDAKTLFARAFESPEQLLKVKNELIALSERLGTDATNALVIKSEQLPAPLLLPPIVRGADTPETMAREIGSLLIGSNVLAQAGGMLTFHDLFSLYNRARGLRLVSCSALLEALELCEKLEILRCRTLASGLRIVEARGELDRAVTQLVRWIATDSIGWRGAAGFSARDVSEHFKWSLPIASEELEVAEQRGHLCRDASIAGLRFFPNKIMHDEIRI